MKRIGRKLRWIALILVAGFTSSFLIQNAALVEIQLFHFSLEARRAYIVGGSLLIGGIVGWLFGVSAR